jgi:hypothetical protein
LRHLDSPLRNLHNKCLALGTTVIAIPIRLMRITHSDSEHLLVLSDAEAAALVEASALLVTASQSVPGATLPPRMAAVLGQLFEGLKVTKAVSSPPQDN